MGEEHRRKGGGVWPEHGRRPRMAPPDRPRPHRHPRLDARAIDPEGCRAIEAGSGQGGIGTSGGSGDAGPLRQGGRRAGSASCRAGRGLRS